ncbi:hypothetical protein SY83_20305 [Paenibacillus swuensis]|uniref:AraC family transcriptional regulator n=1 Tax=Paenibacillus swuensis TaxID=1178515 RepID=A0A172TME3_9BACL|nr:response regulator [Paenibacillus swuensis]ANE48245.1 hypothetical protein SY83_20305 [Paenibacillus swuensis]
MIRTLIVDDEYLVRQGLIHILPWSSHNMTIVGEADNGESALEFLESNEIDLLITDITMPVMGGFDLLRKVRTKHPRLLSVVLTCHQEFQFVQEALKLGALDYMVKTQLEKERVEEVLQRITNRIQQLQAIQVGSEDSPVTTAPLSAPINWGMLLMAKTELPHAAKLLLSQWSGAGLFQVKNNAWFLPRRESTVEVVESERVWEQMDSVHWEVVVVNEIEPFHPGEVSARLSAFLERDWFYEYEHGKQTYYISWAHLRPAKDTRGAGGLKKEAHSEWEKIWHRFSWVYDQSAWQTFRTELLKAKPAHEDILRLAATTVEGWGELLKGDLYEPWKKRLRKATSWQECEQVLGEIRQSLMAAASKLHLSKEVSMSVLQAIDYMRRGMKSGMNQEDVAQKVNISRGYFSKCFKDMVGQPFNELMKQFRIRKAEELLTTTTMPVYRIAEQAGFQDERYFSKVFRDNVGLLPSEYRSSRIGSGAGV